MNAAASLLRIGCVGLLLLFVSCDRARPTGSPPLLQDTSSHSLEAEASDAAAAVDAALQTIDTDPAIASEHLRSAQRSLRVLLDFYLPLYEAREHAYNAYRHLTIGETTAAEVELDQLEEHLLAIAESGNKAVLHEMESALELLVDARAALRSDSVEASEFLRELANRLTSMVVKGGLIVD